MEVSDRLNLVGATLADKYRVERVIGEGGGGIVYQGLNTLLGERVAIKCIRPADGARSKKAAEDFIKEAKLLFRLAHPNIVRMYDVGLLADERGSLPYVVLEYLDGIPLDVDIAQRKAAKRPYSLDEILLILRETLVPMAFAHREGVVHRDLKPSNIMLLDGGKRVKVLDFGTARSGEQVTRLSTLFTPRYAAPEQWDPARGERGGWTDVFALGLVLYELGTLQQAVRGDDMPSILASVMGAVRPSFSGPDGRPDLARLEPVLANATGVEPSSRYRNAGEFLEALERLAKAPRTSSSPIQSATLPLPGNEQSRASFIRALRGTLPLTGATTQVPRSSYGPSGPRPDPSGAHRVAPPHPAYVAPRTAQQTSTAWIVFASIVGILVGCGGGCGACVTIVNYGMPNKVEPAP